MKASNLKSFAFGFGIAISALGLYALAATLNTFKAGDVVSSSKINENFANLNTGKQDRVAATCVEGSSIRVIAADGTVTCQTDNGGAGSPFQFGATLNGADGAKAGLNVSNTGGTGIQTSGDIGLVAKTTGTTANDNGVFASATNAAAVALRADATGGGVAGEFNGKVKVSGEITSANAVGFNDSFDVSEQAVKAAVTELSSVTLNATAAGFATVTADFLADLAHINGQTDRADFQLSQTSASAIGGNDSARAVISIPASFPTFTAPDSLISPVSLTTTFPVVVGANTFFLNGQANSGVGTRQYSTGLVKMTAIYVPKKY